MLLFLGDDIITNLILLCRIEKLAEIIAEQRQPSLPGVGEDTVESSSHSQDDSQLSPASTSSTCDGIDTLLRYGGVKGEMQNHKCWSIVMI